MARPKKEKELTRAKHVTLRLSETQHDIITAAAKQAGLSLSEYIRCQLMNGKVIAKYEIVADLPELRKLTAELGKIGGNINQMPSLRWGRPLPGTSTAAAHRQRKSGSHSASASWGFMK